MSAPAPTDGDAQRRARLHLRLGWWGLAVFIVAGLALETMLGLRVPWYVDASSETRRLMFRLAHAHGTVLSLVNLAYGSSLASPLRRGTLPGWASGAMIVATVSIPLGFAGGGLVIYDADPSLAILLVPIGALALLGAVGAMAASFTARR